MDARAADSAELEAVAVERAARSVDRSGLIIRIGAVAVTLVGWQVLSTIAASRLFPSFTTTLAALADLLGSGKLPGAFISSVQAFALGAGLAFVVGIGAGLILGRSRELEHLFEPVINALLVVPSVAYIPILLIWLGVGFWSRVAVVFESVVLVVLVNTLAGVKYTDRSLVDMGRSFGLGRSAIFRKVVLPSAVPGIFSGLRLGIGRGVKGMINAEVLIAIVGVGGLIKHYGGRFEMDYLLAVILFTVTFSLVLTLGLERIDRRVNRWKPRLGFGAR